MVQPHFGLWAKQPPEPVGGVPLERVSHAAVMTAGESDAGVTEFAADHRDIRSRCQHERPVGVPQGVPGKLRQGRFLERVREEVGEAGTTPRRSLRRGELEAGDRLVPARPSRKLGYELGLALSAPTPTSGRATTRLLLADLGSTEW